MSPQKEIYYQIELLLLILPLSTLFIDSNSFQNLQVTFKPSLVLFISSEWSLLVISHSFLILDYTIISKIPGSTPKYQTTASFTIVILNNTNLIEIWWPPEGQEKYFHFPLIHSSFVVYFFTPSFSYTKKTKIPFSCKTFHVTFFASS